MENLEKDVFTALADNDLANFNDLLDTIFEKRTQTVNGRLIITHKLTHDQSITLFFTSHIEINGKTYYKISRHDNITEAFFVSAPLNLIAEDRSNFYVLGELINSKS